MRYIPIFILSCIIFIAFGGKDGYAQTDTQQGSNQTGSLHSGTIDSQFIYLNRISRSQEGFKLIRPANLGIVRKNVADSLTAQRNRIYETEQQLGVLRNELNGVRDSLRHAQEEVQRIQKAIDDISFLGTDLKKSTYHAFVWSLIAVLVLFILITFVRFKRGNAQALEARNTLHELQEEFELHRKKSLEKEQKLKRELQDEINKRNN